MWVSNDKQQTKKTYVSEKRKEMDLVQGKDLKAFIEYNINLLECDLKNDKLDFFLRMSKTKKLKKLKKQLKELN